MDEEKEVLTPREVSAEEVELKVHSPLNGSAAEEFQRSLNRLLASGYRTITLDLSSATAVNSSCIGKILLLRKSLAEQQRSIRIRGCSDALYNTFQLIKLDRLISIER
jgi:anti-anti-sigma factor